MCITTSAAHLSFPQLGNQQPEGPTSYYSFTPAPPPPLRQDVAHSKCSILFVRVFDLLTVSLITSIVLYNLEVENPRLYSLRREKTDSLLIFGQMYCIDNIGSNPLEHWTGSQETLQASLFPPTPPGHVRKKSLCFNLPGYQLGRIISDNLRPAEVEARDWKYLQFLGPSDAR